MEKEMFIIREAEPSDADQLEQLRVLIDSETEYLDREPGEGYLSPEAFTKLINSDRRAQNNLFLVAECKGELVGFCRLQGSDLQRRRHRVEFGICLKQSATGAGIGKALMKSAIEWADANNIIKVMLEVLDTNEKAIHLYESFGFVQEGVLRMDKKLRDGSYHDTIIMGRITK